VDVLATRSAYHWIDKPHEKGGIVQIGRHLGSLRDGSSDNRGKGACKCKLEEKGLIINIVAHEKEIRVPNKRLGTSFILAAIGKGETADPESDSTSTRIQEVPQEDVLDVLGTDRTGAQHGKASLHEKDQSSLRKKQFLESQLESVAPQAAMTDFKSADMHKPNSPQRLSKTSRVHQRHFALEHQLPKKGNERKRKETKGNERKN
jgi:hypothetical protein